MPLTHDFKATIRRRANTDSAFRESLLNEAAECIINGDTASGLTVVRDYLTPAISDPEDVPAD